ncbi:hypothetical protein [Rhizobium binxianense]
MYRFLSVLLVAATLSGGETPAIAASIEIPTCRPPLGVRIGYRIQSHLVIRPSGESYLAGEDFGNYIQYATVKSGDNSGYSVHWELRPEKASTGSPSASGGLYNEYLNTLAYFNNIASIDIRTDKSGVPDTFDIHVPAAQSYIDGENQFDPVALAQKQLLKGGHSPLESILPQAFLLGRLQVASAGERAVGSSWSHDSSQRINGIDVPIHLGFQLQGVDQDRELATIIWSGGADPVLLAKALKPAQDTQKAFLDAMATGAGTKPADPLPSNGKPAVVIKGTALLSIRDGCARAVEETNTNDDGRFERTQTTTVTRLPVDMVK